MDKKDSWTKCISQSGTIRGVAIQSTELCKELASIHRLKGEQARALGEALVSGLIIASFCKIGEHVNLNIKASGVVSQAFVDAYPEGKVRGYIIPNDQTEIDPNISEFGLGPWGDGLLSILRTKTLEKQHPYLGTVPLLTGHLAKDLTFYWHQSEQVPSAVGLAVNLDEEGNIESAGGFLIQALPGATETEIESIQNHLLNLKSLSKEISERVDPVAILSKVFQDTTFILLENKDLKWECHCSREKIERALLLIGKEELDQLIAIGEAKIECEFCAKDYTTGVEKLTEIKNRISS